MNRLFSTLAAAWLTLPVFAADVPPPERLLPADTLGVITIPDMAKARRLNEQSARMQLWGDPSLKAFKDKLLNKFNEEIIQPFEQESGIQLTNYLDLAQGQVTVALTRNGWTGGPETSPGVLVLIDSKNEMERMKTAMDDVRKRWQGNGNPMRTESIRGVEFSVLIIENATLEGLDPLDTPNEDMPPSERTDSGLEEKVKPTEIFLGQSGTLFLASNSRLDLEKVLSLLNGGPVLSLSESTDFMPDYNRSFREALFYAWMNFEPFIEAIQDSLPESDPNNPFMPSAQRIFRATGLAGMKTLALSSTLKTDGEHVSFHIKVPESERRGLFRLMTFDAKDSAPPPFVPQDAVSFVRYRIDMLKSWRTLEAMITEISPQIGGMLRMSMEAVGKDKDASFDFRRNFVQNLGDDLVSWRKTPRENTVDAMTQQPEMVLLGSPNAEQLAGAFKTLLGMIPPDVAPMEEREFLGRQVWSIKIPLGLPTEGTEPPPSQTIAFSSNAGYVSIATDTALLEEFLRSSEGGSASLIDKPGLRFASEKVGGLNTGLYGYSDDKATMRFLYQFVTSEEGGQTGGMTGLNQFMAAAGITGGEEEFKEWIDLSLLPPFDEIEKYFDYTVYSGAIESGGMHFRLFTPTPRGLR